MSKKELVGWVITSLKLGVGLFFLIPYFYNWCYIPQVIEFWFK